YPAPQSPREGPPALVVTPLINRFRIVDLDPEGSLVGGLTARGVPVHVADWGAPRRIDAGLDFEDYVLDFLPGMLDALETEQVDLVGYCLGGTLAALFAARFPARVRRLVAINAPVAFGDWPHMDLFRAWTKPEHFPLAALVRAHGNMPGALILQGFLNTQPVASATKWAHLGERMHDADFAARSFALESWNLDSVDVPGRLYRRLIEDLYRDDLLAQGRFELAGQAVDLGRIDCPLLVVSSRSDTTCPPEAARALLELASSERKELLELRGGHVLSVVGPRAPKTLHGALAAWLSD
ncbi:MAG: alpha/beta fold hydrolase, partial [Planctomycetota bacterium]